MSGYLFDTNVLSEMLRTTPEPRVVDAVAKVRRFWISTLSVHELVYGVELIAADSRKRARLAERIEVLFARYAGYLLPVQVAEARMAARMRVSARQRGHTLHVSDSLIAATAVVHDLTLATRNTRDFDDLGVALYNPWLADEAS